MTFLKKYKLYIIGFIIIYLLFSIYYSFKANSLINDAHNSNGKNNKYTHIISNYNYKNLDYGLIKFGYEKDTYSKEDMEDIYDITGVKNVSYNDLIEETNKSFPVTIHYFLGGKTYYKYSTKIYAKEKKNKNLICEEENVKNYITFKLDGFKWKVKSVSLPTN